MPQAAGLAAAIKKELGLDVQLVEGSNGIFDVKADGKLIFSKHQEHRFPEHREILDALRGKRGT